MADLYDVNALLALAVAHGARLVTLDTRITRNAVPGATEGHLVTI